MAMAGNERSIKTSYRTNQEADVEEDMLESHRPLQGHVSNDLRTVH
jgi:hypothetical protein